MILAALTSQSTLIASVADNSEYFFGRVTPFSLNDGNMSGPFSTDVDDCQHPKESLCQQESLLRNLFTHSQLNKKSFEEIQGLYMKEQKLIADFVPIGSEEDERMIRDMNKKAKEESSDKERRYALTTRTLKRMMSLRLIAESLSDAAYDLLSFIQKQIDEKEALAIPEQMATGKEISNPFMAEVLIIDCLSIVDTGKVNHIVKIEIVKLVVEIESSGISVDELDKETGSSDGLQPKQADLSYVHALNKPHLHEIHVVPSTYEADQFTLFSSIEGQMSGPFSTDSRIIHPCCLFIMYSSITLFQESYISFSNMGERLSAPKRIALSARVVIEKFIC
nr:hypothetical protein [Tanacetum cinerariifolium]